MDRKSITMEDLVKHKKRCHDFDIKRCIDYLNDDSKWDKYFSVTVANHDARKEYFKKRRKAYYKGLINERNRNQRSVAGRDIQSES